MKRVKPNSDDPVGRSLAGKLHAAITDSKPLWRRDLTKAEIAEWKRWGLPMSLLWK